VRVRVDEFPIRLKARLFPFYLIYGEEPLLVQECADALRAACRKQGVQERQVFDADASFDWDRLAAECSGLSLFGDRKLIEVRLAGGKIGADGSTVLRELAAQPASDNVVLVLAGKLDRDAEKSAWFRAIDEAGATVRAWPLRRHELPGWIGQRLRAAGFRPGADAVAFLAERVEGNLLAARQEVEKLVLLAEPGPLDAATLAELVNDSARYSIYDLCDRALEGDCAAAVRTLAGLRAEGTEAAVVLWALAEEFRRLLRIARRRAEGEAAEQALKAERGKPYSEAAGRRLGHDGLQQLLRLAADVDRAIKGLEKRDAWDSLLGLVERAASPAAARR
jgi:DNA polymerase-3 subunit delta